MKKQIFIIPILFIFLISMVMALTIEEIIPSTASQGFRRLNDLVIYRDGNDLIYNDYLSTRVTVTTLIAGACDAEAYMETGVTAEDAPYDLWFFCHTAGQMVHIDYSTGNFSYFPITAVAGYTEPVIVAVTNDFYIFASKWTSATTVAGVTVNRSNNAYLFETPYQPNQPWYGHHLTTNRRGLGMAFYPDDGIDNTFFQVSSRWDGLNRVAYPNYIHMGAQGQQSRVFSGYASNLSAGIGYFGANEHTDQNKINMWENENYYYIHNGYTDASGFTPTNILFDKNNGLIHAYANTVQLPNGSQVPIRSMELYGDYQLFTYNDLTTELYINNALLIPKGIYSPLTSWNEYHTILDGVIFFNNGTGNYKLTGLPSTIDPAKFNILGQYATVDTEKEYNETILKYNVAYENILTGDMSYNPNFTSIDNDAYTYPYIELDPDEGVLTEFLQTDFVLRGFDITDDELYVAYDCFYDTKEFNVIDYDNFENYTDLGYSSACEGTKRLYTVRDPDLQSFYNTDQFERNYEGSTYTPYETNYIDFNTSYCIQNLYYEVESNPETSVTFVQEFIMGYNTGIQLDFQNMIGDTIGYIRIMRDNDIGYNDYINITINGESYISYDDMLYFDSFVGDPIVSVNIYMTGTSMSYIMLINGNFYRQGEATNYKTLPIDKIIWTTQTPSGSFNNDQYLGIGSWILVKGKTTPQWNKGVQFKGYDDTGHKYYKFMCDYAGRTDKNHQLRVYLNDAPMNDYSQFTDRWIMYDTNYATYLKQLEDKGMTLEEDRIIKKQTVAKTFWCEGINVCDDNSRMVFALLITLFFTFGGAILMYRKYENTLSSRLLPVCIYVALFTYFASIGFFHEWYVALNIIFILGALAITFNPSQRFGGGGGG